MRKLVVGAAFCVATALWCNPFFSQAKDEKNPEAAKPAATTPPPPAKPTDKPATATPPTAAKPAGDKPAPGGDDIAAMMELWRKATAPGEFHTKLNPLVGKWTFVTKARMDADQPFEESTGKAEYKWGLGKRVLYQEVKANPSKNDALMGGPFEGFGMSGYDNTSKKYYNVWADSMSTGVMMSTGTADASGKIFTYAGEYDDPISGEKKSVKSVLKIAGDDKVVFEMYEKDPDGREYMSLDISYVRQK